jgi:hypothetical protein
VVVLSVKNAQIIIRLSEEKKEKLHFCLNKFACTLVTLVM